MHLFSNNDGAARAAVLVLLFCLVVPLLASVRKQDIKKKPEKCRRSFYVMAFYCTSGLRIVPKGMIPSKRALFGNGHLSLVQFVSLSRSFTRTALTNDTLLHDVAQFVMCVVMNYSIMIVLYCGTRLARALVSVSGWRRGGRSRNRKRLIPQQSDYLSRLT